MFTLDTAQVQEAARELYIRALKILPDDIKQGFQTLASKETNTTAQSILGTMIKNISVAEDNNNLLCQDTGIPIYNLMVGTQVDFNGAQLIKAIEQGCSRATVEHPIRSSVVHPITRKNNHTSCGHRVPVVNISFVDRPGWVRLEMIPKGSGSENNSWLKMATPAEGIAAVKTFVVDCVLEAGGKTCPPTIVGRGRRRDLGPLHSSCKRGCHPTFGLSLCRPRRCSPRKGTNQGGECLGCWPPRAWWRFNKFCSAY